MYSFLPNRWTLCFPPAALVARKNVTLDASALPLGVTLRWAGNPATPARVLAVFGNVALKNITVTGGRSVAEARADPAQPFTLARGGGLAVWGKATLTGCTFYDNAVTGDTVGSRDRGAFGGAVYGDRLILSDCLIAGNAAVGFGAAGGGVYSVGGIAATIGNAHVVENMILAHSIIAGNTVNANRDDVIDRSASLTDATILSVGVGEGLPIILGYPPRGAALNRIPFSYRGFDAAAGGRLGPNAGLDDTFWSSFRTQPSEGPVSVRFVRTYSSVQCQRLDQMGRRRPSNGYADVGALEVP